MRSTWILVAAASLMAACSDTPSGPRTTPTPVGPDVSWVANVNTGTAWSFNRGWVDLAAHRNILEAWVTTSRTAYQCGRPEFRMTRSAESQDFTWVPDVVALNLPAGSGMGLGYCWRNPLGGYVHAQFGPNFDKLSPATQTQVCTAPSGDRALALFRKNTNEFVLDNTLVRPEWCAAHAGGGGSVVALSHSGGTNIGVSLNAGQTLQLTARTPTVTGNGNFNWSAGNSAVVTVDANGLVSAKAAGTTPVCAVLKTDVSQVGCIDITVSGVVTVTVSLTGPDSVLVGNNVTFAASTNTGVSGNTNFNWSSNNTAIATVDGNGVVTGRAAGSASICAALKTDTTKSGCRTIAVKATVASNDTTWVVRLKAGSNGTVLQINGNRMMRNGARVNPLPANIFLVGDLWQRPDNWDNSPFNATLVDAGSGIYELNVANLKDANGVALSGLSFNTFRVVTSTTDYWLQYANRSDLPGVCLRSGNWVLGMKLTAGVMTLTCT